jgi:pimeloyl-ACP methyl ester carboxylesterase
MNTIILPVTKTGKGLPLMLLHGLGANRHQWEEFIPEDLNFTIILPDFPGHGGAACIPTDGCSFTSFAAELVGLINSDPDMAGNEKLVIGGISMGAGVALSVALMLPEKVKGLFLLRPAWLNKPRPQNLEILHRLGDFLKNNSVEETRQWLLKDDLFKRLEIENKTCAASVMNHLNRPDRTIAGLTLTGMTNSFPFKEFSDLRKLSCQVLVAGSADDQLHPLDMAQRLAGCIPGSEFKEVPSRYSNPKEHLIEVRRLLSSFLSQL